VSKIINGNVKLYLVQLHLYDNLGHMQVDQVMDVWKMQYSRISGIIHQKEMAPHIM
jgi:hypothetical protein